MIQVEVAFDGSVGMGQSTTAPFSGSLEVDGGAWTASIPLLGEIGEVQYTIPETNIGIVQITQSHCQRP